MRERRKVRYKLSGVCLLNVRGDSRREGRSAVRLLLEVLVKIGLQIGGFRNKWSRPSFHAALGPFIEVTRRFIDRERLVRQCLWH